MNLPQIWFLFVGLIVILTGCVGYEDDPYSLEYYRPGHSFETPKIYFTDREVHFEYVSLVTDSESYRTDRSHLSFLLEKKLDKSFAFDLTTTNVVARFERGEYGGNPKRVMSPFSGNCPNYRNYHLVLTFMNAGTESTFDGESRHRCTD
jgi:hypothetical protein